MRTKPLLLVLPLLWYLSGVSGLAAAVCAPARAERCCCCQRAEAEAAPDAQPASLTAMMSHATSSRCPCTLAPKPADPVPAAAPSPAPETRAEMTTLVVSPLGALTAACDPLSSSHSTSDDSPPYLTAANPRC